jgi:hypothetical protein
LGWFLDMEVDEAGFDATVFSKNRERLMEHEAGNTPRLETEECSRGSRYYCSIKFVGAAGA